MPAPKGSAPGHARPIVIIQSNDFNRSNLSTIIAVCITSNVALAFAPGNVLLKKRGTGLSRESVINVSQLVTLDKSDLSERIGRLPRDKLAELEDGLRLVLSL